MGLRQWIAWIIIEKVLWAAMKCWKRDTIKVYDIQTLNRLPIWPTSFVGTDIFTGKKLKMPLLRANCLDTGIDVCPNCGGKTEEVRYRESDLATVLSDHKLRVQKHSVTRGMRVGKVLLVSKPIWQFNYPSRFSEAKQCEHKRALYTVKLSRT